MASTVVLLSIKCLIMNNHANIELIDSDDLLKKITSVGSNKVQYPVHRISRAGNRCASGESQAGVSRPTSTLVQLIFYIQNGFILMKKFWSQGPIYVVTNETLHFRIRQLMLQPVTSSQLRPLDHSACPPPK